MKLIIKFCTILLLTSCASKKNLDYQVVNTIIKDFEGRGKVSATAFNLKVSKHISQKTHLENLVDSKSKKRFSDCDYTWVMKNPKKIYESFDKLKKTVWDEKYIISTFDVDFSLKDSISIKNYRKDIENIIDLNERQIRKQMYWSVENGSMKVITLSQPIFNNTKNAAIAFSSATVGNELSGEFMWFLNKVDKVWLIDCYVDMMFTDLN